MAKRKTGKKSKNRISLVKSLPPSVENYEVKIRADYFARFRYSLEEVLIILESEGVKNLNENSQTRQILEDFGYWSLIQANAEFVLSEDLIARLKAQFAFLNKSLQYAIGDQVRIITPISKQLVNAVIVDHECIEEADFYVVEFAMANAAKQLEVFTKTELDQINLLGCSLPEDSFNGEGIDWDNDLVWLKKVEDFKTILINGKFEIDFRSPKAEIETKIKQLTTLILTYFKLKAAPPEYSLKQIGHGLGMLACGSGDALTQLFVYCQAFQAVGHIFGARIVAVDEIMNDLFIAALAQDEKILTKLRSVSEVAEKLMARGAFGGEVVQSVKELEPTVRREILAAYLAFKKENTRLPLAKALAVKDLFANLVKFNAQSN